MNLNKSYFTLVALFFSAAKTNVMEMLYFAFFCLLYYYYDYKYCDGVGNEAKLTWVVVCCDDNDLLL